MLTIASVPDRHFNSHAHVERDTISSIVFSYFVGISTHTLTWSVTQPALISVDVEKISTHTLTWSVTVKPLTGIVAVLFQLTRSRGA